MRFYVIVFHIPKHVNHLKIYIMYPQSCEILVVALTLHLCLNDLTSGMRHDHRRCAAALTL